ncbi:MAG: hypothetical protein ABSC17_08570 [Thermacetogeniaceae bacterium]
MVEQLKDLKQVTCDTSLTIMQRLMVHSRLSMRRTPVYPGLVRCSSLPDGCLLRYETSGGSVTIAAGHFLFMPIAG